MLRGSQPGIAKPVCRAIDEGSVFDGQTHLITENKRNQSSHPRAVAGKAAARVPQSPGKRAGCRPPLWRQSCRRASLCDARSEDWRGDNRVAVCAGLRFGFAGWLDYD